VRALWWHLGELQPLSVLARVRATNQQAARAGIPGRRVVLRLLAVPTAAAFAALIVWGVDALGWILLMCALGALTTTLWSARRRGSRWLMPLVPLLMIWPFIEIRMATGRGEVAISESLTATLLLAAALAAHQLWRRGLGDGPTWRYLATLATAPLWWASSIFVHARIDRFLLPDGYVGAAVTRARFGLPVDETMFALGLTVVALVAAYWVLLGLVIARVANRYRTPPSEDDDRPEAIWL
jgi:hypothetical protein